MNNLVTRLIEFERQYLTTDRFAGSKFAQLIVDTRSVSDPTEMCELQAWISNHAKAEEWLAGRVDTRSDSGGEQ